MAMLVQGRRRFLQTGLRLAGFALLAGCALRPSEPPPRTRRIGYFTDTSTGLGGPGTLDGPSAAGFLAFRNALRDLGYEVGQNLELDLRVADVSNVATYAERAAEIVALGPDVLVASRTAPAMVLARAIETSSRPNIPLVFVGVGAPVEIGLVQSLSRPGRNVTGFTSFSPELANKRLELLKEAAPSVNRPAVIWNPADPDDAHELAAMQAAASRYGLTLRPVEIHAQADVEPAVRSAARDGADAIILVAKFGPNVGSIVAVQARLPAVSARSSATSAFGGLFSYGVDTTDMHRRAAAHVDRLLKGGKAADLPVEQPTKFDLVINLKTAAELRLTVPASVLAQATEIVQ
jgi:putative ABC transport system substrate-binding protein